MKRACRALLALIACSAPAGAADATEDATARALAAGCLGCHQPIREALPVLHGQPRESLAGKFRAFRDGAQTGTVMPQLAKGYTDAQIDAIASYFAAHRTPQ
jgi:cytochrome subunit of sulfide dehydrogenase